MNEVSGVKKVERRVGTFKGPPATVVINPHSQSTAGEI